MAEFPFAAGNVRGFPFLWLHYQSFLHLCDDKSGRSSLPCMIKVMAPYFVTDCHKVVTMLCQFRCNLDW